MSPDGKDNGQCDFFVEAIEPKSHIGKIEILMEDFGEHSGYPREQKLADAKLDAAAPEMLELLQEALVGWEWRKENTPEQLDKADYEHIEKIKTIIKKAIG